jgi:hypothetical protein
MTELEDGEGEVCSFLEGLERFSADTSNISQTALHKAAYRGHLDVCQFLSAAGVNVDAADGDGWTVSSVPRSGNMKLAQPFHHSLFTTRLRVGTSTLDACLSTRERPSTNARSTAILH